MIIRTMYDEYIYHTSYNRTMYDEIPYIIYIPIIRTIESNTTSLTPLMWCDTQLH